jgi:hypothetical protein
MFENVSRFFTATKNFFFNGIGKIKDTIVDIVHIPGRVINTIHEDAKDVLSAANKTVMHVIDKTTETANHVISGAQNVIQTGQKTIGDTISHTADSLSFPLVLLGGALGLFMLTKK